MSKDELRVAIFEIINKNCDLLDSGGYCILMDDIADEIVKLISDNET